MPLVLGFAPLAVSDPACLERHVLALLHEVQDMPVVREFATWVVPAFSGNFTVDFHGDSGVRDADRERVIQSFAMFKGVNERRISDVLTTVWRLISLADSRLLRMSL